jgi:hypothetical protein
MEKAEDGMQEQMGNVIRERKLQEGTKKKC